MYMYMYMGTSIQRREQVRSESSGGGNWWGMKIEEGDKWGVEVPEGETGEE